MWNIAVVGPGLMGKQHIERIQQLDCLDLCAIVAPVSVENQSYTDSLNIPMYTELQTCIEQCQPDGIIIASPNEFHLEQALISICNKIPVLIEKPLATSLVNGLAILECAEKNNFTNKVMVGHHRAYSPIIQKASDVVQSGMLGRIVTFQGSAQFYKPLDYFAQGEWRTRIGGGPILINLIHEIGNMRELVGEIEEVQVLISKALRGFEVEDSAVINLRFNNGALGTFVLSDTAASNKSWEMTSGENPSFPFYPTEHCYTVTGTRGSLDIPTMKVRAYQCEKLASWLEPFEEAETKIERKDPLIVQLKNFAQVIQGEANPLVSVIDGYRNLAVVEAIQKAGTTGITEKVVY